MSKDNRSGHRRMTHFECRKCGSRFNVSEIIKYKQGGVDKKYHICPICKSQSYVELVCGHCDHYKSRMMPCGMGHRTIVPFSVACWDWKIRDINKKVVI